MRWRDTGRELKTPAGGSTHLPGLGVGVVFVCSLEHKEFFSPTDGRPSAVYPELDVNVSGVRPQGAQGVLLQRCGQVQ